MDLYIHALIRLHGVVFNYLSTGITLRVTFFRILWDFTSCNHQHDEGEPCFRLDGTLNFI
jgi:hypothetical protein